MPLTSCSDFKEDMDGSVVFIDSVASCWMNASLGWPPAVVSFPEWPVEKGSSSGFAVAGSVCSPGCCERPSVEQHVISSSSTDQAGSHFRQILSHDVSFPILFFLTLRWLNISVSFGFVHSTACWRKYQCCINLLAILPKGWDYWRQNLSAPLLSLLSA